MLIVCGNDFPQLQTMELFALYVVQIGFFTVFLGVGPCILFKVLALSFYADQVFVVGVSFAFHCVLCILFW